MNVRFFGGTKEQYLSLATPRNPLGLYFCADTRELFWGDKLLTDGTRIIATEADLPNLAQAADGITYFVEATRNGYVISPDRAKWIQVIHAPEDGGTVKVISFAGIEMEEVEGIFTIDRRCAREALGFIVPEGMEDEELEIATKDYVDEKIAAINPVVEEVKTKLETEVLPKVEETILPTIQKVEEVLPTVQELAEKAATREWVREQGYLTEHQSLEGLATEEFVKAKIAEAELNDKDVDLTGYATKDDLAAIEAKIPSDYLTTIPSEYITETELTEAIANIEYPSIDLSGYATTDDVETVNTKVTNITEQITEVTQNIENIENTYVTNEILEQNYITQEEIANIYVTEEHISNTYVTVQQAADTYVTNEQVTEVVTNEVNTVVTEQIETKVTEIIQEKAEAGEIVVKADSISYGEF